MQAGREWQVFPKLGGLGSSLFSQFCQLLILGGPGIAERLFCVISTEEPVDSLVVPDVIVNVASTVSSGNMVGPATT